VRRALFWIGVLACLVLLLATGVAASRASAGNGRHLLKRAWSLSGVAPLSLVRARLLAGQEPVVIATTVRAVIALSAEGRELARLTPGGPVVASATGDLTGDGVDELLVLDPVAVSAYSGDLRRPLWKAALGPGQAGQRVLPVDLDADKRREVVVASLGGKLTCFSPAGQPLWSWAPAVEAHGDDANVRGLDDVKLGRARLVALGLRDGRVVILDGQGRAVFEGQVPDKLRRLRALELGEGDGVVFTGSDDGIVRRLDPPTRAGGAGSYQLRPVLSLGEDVTELRPAEIDGNPLSREMVAGGKRGRVMAAGAAGSGGNVGERVSALAGVDVDGDGRDEIAVGTEPGHVYLNTAQGEWLAELPVGGKVETLLALPGQAGGRVLAVGTSSLTAYAYELQSAPIWYHPVAAVLVGLLALAVVATVLSRFQHPQAVAPRPVSGRDWRRGRLIEARRKVEALRGKGQAREEDLRERLAEIDRQVAALDRAERPAARPTAASPPPPRRR
jgi:hypothetical protein